MAGKADVGKTETKFDWVEMGPGEFALVLDEMYAKPEESHTLMVWGPPSVAKSAVVAQRTKKAGRWLIDDRLSQKDPTDIRGVYCAPTDPKATTARLLCAPEYEPLWTGDTPTTLFYDEHNHASELLQKASYEVALDHAIGGRPFKKGTVVILAGNREMDNANVTPMEGPMQTRVVHIYIKFSAPDAQAHAEKAGQFHPAVLSYLNERPDMWYPGLKEPMSPDRTYLGEPNPRMWEKVSWILRTFKRAPVEKLVAGALGPGASMTFMAWLETAGKLTPIIEAVLAGRNDMATEFSAQYFVCQSLVERFRTERKLATRLLDYSLAIKSKFPEMGSVIFQSGWAVDNTAMKASPSWGKAIKEYAQFIA
jgi:hypothetical protein